MLRDQKVGCSGPNPSLLELLGFSRIQLALIRITLLLRDMSDLAHWKHMLGYMTLGSEGVNCVSYIVFKTCISCSHQKVAFIFCCHFLAIVFFKDKSSLGFSYIMSVWKLTLVRLTPLTVELSYVHGFLSMFLFSKV